MGCGGSKQDVATGNTVSRCLLRREPSIAKSKSSSSDADASSSNESSKQVSMTEVDGVSASIEKAPVEVAKNALVAKDAPMESPDEQLPCTRDIGSLDAATRSEGAEYISPAGTEDAAAAGNDLVERVLDGDEQVGSNEDKDNKKSDDEEEKNEISTKEEEEEVESIGRRSVDFKESISIIEEEEAAEVTGETEKNNSGGTEIVKEAAAH